LLERGAHALRVRTQPFHLTRTENPRLAVTPWNVTATLPARRFPLAFFGTRHLQATRSSTNAPLLTMDLLPFAAHLIAASSSAISKSLRSTAMAATNGVNDQVLRWQRELRGYRLRFPEAGKPGAQRAREKALGCASVGNCTLSGTIRFTVDSWLLLSYPKARRKAGLRCPWTPRAGVEPASLQWTAACSTA
jgi:hypothetical protein